MINIHKETNVEYKTCSECNEVKSLDEFYFQIKKSKKKGEYIYYNPKCKKCCYKNALKWQYDNYEFWKKKVWTRGQKEEVKHAKYLSNKRRQQDGYLQEYQKNNPDRIKKYRENRYHKNHNISKTEWLKCKHYFNNSCAYCGLHESNHYRKHGGKLKLFDLHKEHVDHNGANDLSNCVPSCQSCNSSKWIYSINEWYNRNNLNFSEERLNRILEWLEEDYLNNCINE